MNVKLRKTGNSAVITIPLEIQRTLGASIGEEIEFVTDGHTVKIKKAEPTFHFDIELQKALTQYDELMKELVDK
ncbi:AbrB/MazE/SpoVT family DNA-binding domain-containing protein [Streptococcus marmotae]|uniref:AbrB/MazE/SpoVT family DNA-binding domain-containing protein n=1 Tax=Streptococcus marmotae TaxID=1825069 RepID=UPI00082B587B|nr:AbrB/MazE/SpoVT family DNA-binding domain-containing protein [Streptococcus marmotae]